MVAEAKKLGVLRVSSIYEVGFDNVVKINFVKSEYYKNLELVFQGLYVLKIGMAILFAILAIIFAISSSVLECKNLNFIHLYNKSTNLQIVNNTLSNKIDEQKALYNIGKKIQQVKSFSEPLQVIHIGEENVRHHIILAHTPPNITLPVGY